MIITNPTYISGDNLSLTAYIQYTFSIQKLQFTSIRKWWKLTTLFWGSILVVFCLSILIGGVNKYISAGEEVDWSFVGACSIFPLIIFYPLILAIYYYNSFIIPRKISHKIEAFIKEYIPDAKKIAKVNYNSYSLQWKETEYSIAYTEIKDESKKGILQPTYHCFILCLFYTVPSENIPQIFTRNGQLQQSFEHEWEAYCAHKESCRFIVLTPFSAYALWDKRYITTADIVTKSMDSLHYLCKKFKLLPLPLNLVYKKINDWLNLNDLPAPKYIKVLHLGIFETETGYALYLIGGREFDANDEEWICKEDFTPKHKYLEISHSDLQNTPNITPINWQQFEWLVLDIIGSYVYSCTHKPSSVFYKKIVTAGFDDGNLHLIMPE